MDNQQIITEDVNETSDAKDDMVRAGIFFLLLLIFQIPLSVLLGKVHELFPNVSVYLLSILMTQGYLLFGALIFLLCVGKKFTRDLHLQKYKISSFFLSLLVLITASPMEFSFSGIQNKAETFYSDRYCNQCVIIWLDAYEF